MPNRRHPNLIIKAQKFQAGHFGRCRYYLCSRQNVLPVRVLIILYHRSVAVFFVLAFVGSVFLLYFHVQIGISDKLGQDYVKVYCPKCNDIYDTDRSKVDGAYFGRTFPHFLLICRPDLLPRTTVSAADSKYAIF